MAIKAINVVSSTLAGGKLIEFNIEVNSVVQTNEDASNRNYSLTVANDGEREAALQSYLAAFKMSTSSPTDPVSCADVTLTE